MHDTTDRSTVDSTWELRKVQRIDLALVGVLRNRLRDVGSAAERPVVVSH